MNPQQRALQASNVIEEISGKIIESNTTAKLIRNLCITTSVQEISTTQFYSILGTIVDTNENLLKKLDDLSKILSGFGVKHEKQENSEMEPNVIQFPEQDE